MMALQPPVHYRIVPQSVQAHLFAVDCTVAQPAAGGQRVYLPAWLPGSYMIRDFARHLIQCRADCAGQPVAIHKLDKNTWQCAPCAGPLHLYYEVYAHDPSIREAFLDERSALFNGSSVFVGVEGYADTPCTVEIVAPLHPLGDAWQVATTLPRAGAALRGFGTYWAADYATLIDHPVWLGQFSWLSFEVGGVLHEMAIAGRHYADLARLRADLAKICACHTAFFGEMPVAERYLFLLLAVDEGCGGLEHRSSCALLAKRDDLPQLGQPVLSEGYRRLLGLCSHEYFHTWHVKRIQPLELQQAELQREAYTRQLWIFEGITSYYDDLALLRANCISLTDYLVLLAQTITRVWRSPGRFQQSLADSSFDAWIKLYRPGENTPNAVISYYTKGALLALALDLTLRRDTDGRISLDTVMQALWQAHGKTGLGLPPGGFERLVERISGLDLQDFFARYVSGTEELPLSDLLNEVGIDWLLRPADSPKDEGGKPSTLSADTSAQRGSLHLRLKNQQGQVQISQVFAGGAAQTAGLSPHDVLVAIDGLRVRPDTVDAQIASYLPGTRLPVHVFRRDELRCIEVTWQAPTADTCVLSLRPDCDPATQARRQAWLFGTKLD